MSVMCVCEVFCVYIQYTLFTEGMLPSGRYTAFKSRSNRKSTYLINSAKFQMTSLCVLNKHLNNIICTSYHTFISLHKICSHLPFCLCLFERTVLLTYVPFEWETIGSDFQCDAIMRVAVNYKCRAQQGSVLAFSNAR